MIESEEGGSIGIIIAMVAVGVLLIGAVVGALLYLRYKSNKKKFVIDEARNKKTSQATQL